MKYALMILLLACGGSKPKPTDDTKPPVTANDCVKSGCSGTVCVEPGKEVVTTCEFKPEYACYRDAACERQGDGSCGWTTTPALTDCLAHPPAADASGAPQ
jgi:eight-cysteine-cluster-containing protein